MCNGLVLASNQMEKKGTSKDSLQPADTLKDFFQVSRFFSKYSIAHNMNKKKMIYELHISCAYL